MLPRRKHDVLLLVISKVLYFSDPTPLPNATPDSEVDLLPDVIVAACKLQVSPRGGQHTALF
jgi:hypothetical protein